MSYDELHDLDWEEKLRYLQERLQRSSLLSSDADIAQLRGHVQVYRANGHLYYTPPQEVSPIPITLFKACEVTPERAEYREQTAMFNDPSWGWDQYSAGPVDIREVPGDHITMLAKPHVQGLAAQLHPYLER